MRKDLARGLSDRASSEILILCFMVLEPEGLNWEDRDFTKEDRSYTTKPKIYGLADNHWGNYFLLLVSTE